MIILSLFKGVRMSDATVPVSIETRLDSTDAIRESLINTIVNEVEESQDKLVCNDKLMSTLTMLLRDRDSTNAKRLRISADKEMAKKSGEEAKEIMQMVLDRNKALKEQALQNPEAQASKREIDRSLVPDVEITEENIAVGVSTLNYDNFVSTYEAERGIVNRT